MAATNGSDTTFYPVLRAYLEARNTEFDLITEDRKADLAKLSHYVQTCISHSISAKLNFICTHNSRRSHLGQIWAHVAAEFYRIKNVETFSGGTEATAFNPRAVAALKRAGLHIESDSNESANPRYVVKSSDTSSPSECFSKRYDAPSNPKDHFCAIMTCSQADEACPLVAGCDLRLPIRYEDPKIADGTPQESQLYDERCSQICREMLYMASLVK